MLCSPSLLVLMCAASAAAYGVQLPAGLRATSLTHQRCASAVEMKGRGTMGMPGKGVKPPSGSGMQKGVKRRMQQRDFGRSEWTLVAEKGDLSDDVGATLVVEAGQSPMGQNYIWTLIRSETGAGALRGDEESSNVYATDGSCRACTFPMSKSTISKVEGGDVLTCASCGSKFAMEDGAVIEWLPGEGPVQWLAKQVNSNKEEMAAGVLPTRVSKGGRVYVRLPDGTLPITKTAQDRADELSGAAAPMTAKERVEAAQAKAKGNKGQKTA